MKTFISLSNYPGSTGKYFYNKFFEYYNIDAVYIPKKSVNLKEDLEQAVLDKVSGISISMPFKQEIIWYIIFTNKVNSWILRDDSSPKYQKLQILRCKNTIIKMKT